ncbi:MAG: glycosyltransferase [Actinomycetaceae bacterium]|nr:glycosyltransferase [Actinomycetaceae bacterium]
MNGVETSNPQPKVLVLLATYNAGPWIQEQLSSILEQADVELSLLVSDDDSTDGTREYLEEIAHKNPRVSIAPKREGAAGSAQNFLYLCHLALAYVGDYDWVAFADQDDIWHSQKLIRQVDLAVRWQASGVSSSVLALYPDGHLEPIRKDYPQRPLDYVCESPGPGCTFLMRPEVLDLTLRAAKAIDSNEVGFHDWLVYAATRAAGKTWVIGSWPSVKYRQHASNVHGANRGLGAIKQRLGQLSSGWYRRQFILMATAAVATASSEDTRADLQRVLRALESKSLAARLEILRLAPHLRRRRRDQFVLGALVLLGIW